MRKGLWVLRNSNPPLYTDEPADIIKHKATGKEYIRGKRILFKEGEVPPKVEDSGEYEFIYLKGRKPATLTTEEAATGLYVNSLFK